MWLAQTPDPGCTNIANIIFAGQEIGAIVLLLMLYLMTDAISYVAADSLYLDS